MIKDDNIKDYVQKKVQPFLTPLTMDLVKNHPENVYEHIVNWLETTGLTINQKLKQTSLDENKSEDSPPLIEVKTDKSIPPIDEKQTVEANHEQPNHTEEIKDKNQSE